MCGVLALIYLITGAVAGHYSAQWDEWVEFADDFRDQFGISSSDRDNGVNIRGALGAACVSFLPVTLTLKSVATIVVRTFDSNHGFAMCVW